MAGLDPAIHAFTCCHPVRTCMPGSSPGMTEKFQPEFSMNRLFVAALFSALLPLLLTPANAAERELYGIDLEGFAYPYPVNLLPLVNDGEQLRMA
jgi:hypothetical protein